MNKIDFVHKMLYDDQKLPEIQSNHVFSNEASEVLPAERCQEGPVVSAIEEVVESEEEIDWNEIPSALCAAEVQTWSNDKVDFRPHLYDPQLDQFILVDSGSQCSAWPPDPGDQVDSSLVLKAVNHTRMKCFGYKEIEVKIGRKTYRYRVIKSEVDSPILGWDFTKIRDNGL